MSKPPLKSCGFLGTPETTPRNLWFLGDPGMRNIKSPLRGELHALLQARYMRPETERVTCREELAT